MTPSHRSPTVSVVIPSFRRLGRLPDLVAAYADQGADQVVVVLDGPHPGWQDALGDVALLPGVRIEELPRNRGLALARIAGLEHASEEVVFVTDDDVVPQPGLLARHRSFHRGLRDRVLLGYMPVNLPSTRGRDDAPSFLYSRDYEKQVANWRRSDSRLILGSLWGGNFSLPRQLYQRAELYMPSQRLEYSEDLDLGLRLRAVGAEASFDEFAAGLHEHHRDFQGFVRECEVRGAAAADLEARWGALPAQLRPLISIPAEYPRGQGWLQRTIAARDSPGALEFGLGAAYRVCGMLGAWRTQDAIARLLRRALAMRGYRARQVGRTCRQTGHPVRRRRAVAAGIAHPDRHRTRQERAREPLRRVTELELAPSLSASGGRVGCRVQCVGEATRRLTGCAPACERA